eukprot:Sdes_comp9180_c0_seq1m648
MILVGDKGYCSGRATHGVTYGTWFYEIQILESDGISYGENQPHCRVGWSQKHLGLETPCGYDSFSYSYGDKTGNKFTQSVGEKYGETFTKGDVIGILIDLPVENSKYMYQLSVSATSAMQNDFVKTMSVIQNDVIIPSPSLKDHPLRG